MRSSFQHGTQLSGTRRARRLGVDLPCAARRTSSTAFVCSTAYMAAAEKRDRAERRMPSSFRLPVAVEDATWYRWASRWQSGLMLRVNSAWSAPHARYPYRSSSWLAVSFLGVCSAIAVSIPPQYFLLPWVAARMPVGVALQTALHRATRSARVHDLPRPASVHRFLRCAATGGIQKAAGRGRAAPARVAAAGAPPASAIPAARANTDQAPAACPAARAVVMRAAFRDNAA